jgi:CRAL/TRIO domain
MSILILVQLAVKRYVKYWDKRVEAFGPIYAFQPLTLTGALRDDTVPLELGAMHVIRRNKARDILYFDPSKLDKTKYSRESARRAFWYFCHALLEDADVQKRGMIILNFNRHFSNSNRDPQFTKMCVSTIKGALPIRMSAIHGCHVPYMYSCAIALVMLFLGERLRKRILLHNGTNEHVLTVLEDEYRIAAQHIPTDMGGLLQLNVLAWLEERRADGL